MQPAVTETPRRAAVGQASCCVEKYAATYGGRGPIEQTRGGTVMLHQRPPARHRFYLVHLAEIYEQVRFGHELLARHVIEANGLLKLFREGSGDVQERHLESPVRVDLPAVPSVPVHFRR